MMVSKAACQRGVARGKAGLDDELIEAGVVSGLAFDFEQARGLVFVGGAKGLLFAGATVLEVVGSATAEHVEPLFHFMMIRTGEKHRAGVAAELNGVVSEARKIAPKRKFF